MASPSAPGSSPYRRLGADPPFGDPRRAHGVDMEGYYWRVSDSDRGLVAIALSGICQGPEGSWATLALAADPQRFLRETIAAPAEADPGRLAVAVGERFVADEEHLAVDLGPDARLELSFRDPIQWPRRLWGALGVAHWLPGLGQYWHPHVLGGRADGELVTGSQRIRLNGARVYAEKNWGSTFPRRWWWGQAHDFADADVCLAFAGGALAPGVAASGIVVRLERRLIRLAAPLALVRARADPTHWRLSGRSPRYAVDLEGWASGPPFLLPVPVPDERRNEARAHQQLSGRLRLRVREGRRTRFDGETQLAGLEFGG